MQRSLGDLLDKDQTRVSTESVDSKGSAKDQELNGKLKGINEKTQLFRITSNAMVNVS